MKPLQTILFLSFFLLLNSIVTAQNLLEYIPKDAALVAGINPKVLKEKANFEAIREMDFYQSILDEIAKGKDAEANEILSYIFQSPSKYGMDFNSPSYLFVEKATDGFFVNYIFKLSEANKFDEFFRKQIQKNNLIEIRKRANYHLINYNGIAIAWNDKVVLTSTGETKSKFQGEDISQLKPDVNEVLESLIARAMSSEKSSSILQNTQFLKAQSMPNDAFMWMDYGYMMEIGKLSEGRLNKAPVAVPEMDQLIEKLKGTYLMTGLNFDQGKMQLKSKYFFNHKMNDIVEGMLDVDINPKFSRFIEKENLLGYYSFAFNIEKTIKGLMKLYGPELTGEYSDVDKLLTQGLDSLGLAMRPSQIYNMFKGDMMFAITGVEEFETEVTTYDYDEDFNRTEVKKLKRETLPIFTMMMSYNNKKDLMTFIQMGEDASVLENKGNYYQISFPGAPSELYLAMEKGILFISNNTKLINGNLKRGLKKKYRMDKKHLLALKKNVQIFYLDMNKVLDKFSDMTDSMDSTDSRLLNISKQNIDSFWMTAQKSKAGVMDSSFDLIFSNPNVNSLEQLILFFNDVFSSFSKEKRG